MTAIIGIEHAGQVWLAGDAHISNCGLRVVSREPKVRTVSGLVLGAAGGCRECCIAMTWAPPRYSGRGDPWRWVTTELVTRLWQAMADDGVGRADVSVEVLVGVAGKLFAIDGHGGVDSSAAGFAAIGTSVACAAALGNLMATRRYSPRYRLRSALRAAAAISPEVCPPWVMVSA